MRKTKQPLRIPGCVESPQDVVSTGQTKCDAVTASMRNHQRHSMSVDLPALKSTPYESPPRHRPSFRHCPRCRMCGPLHQLEPSRSGGLSRTTGRRLEVLDVAVSGNGNSFRLSRPEHALDRLLATRNRRASGVPAEEF